MRTPTLGDRMKGHEHAYRQHLPRRAYTLFRLDGRSFSKYTRGLVKPFDDQFATDMDATAIALCAEVTGTVLAYVQSDEISLLVTDFSSTNTEPWMGGVTAKMLSLSAALATATFNRLRPATTSPALFDSRVFTLTDPVEVANYFVWRQRDALKNSVSMAASAHFSHNRLDRLNTDQRRELLTTEANKPWETYPIGHRQGRVVLRVPVPGTATFVRDGQTHTIEVVRNVWTAQDAPQFTTGSDGWLTSRIPAIPEQITPASTP